MSMIGHYLRLPEARLAELLAHPETVMDVLYPEDDSDLVGSLDIDKSWHVIHFLLNGKTWDGEWPLMGAVLGGTVVSDEDVGYGPARYLTPREVQEVDAALQAVGSEALLSRFDPDAIRRADLYPEGWVTSEAAFAYIASNYEALRTFFHECAAGRDAMIEYLS